ncbi:MAG: hypothetical protein E7478_10000 [Ruminococcaceae bacterium]|nr:hypothetical protein [Oscillospiraceae bacterium]
MIRKCISCVFKISDGITRQPVTASAVCLYVDGVPVRAEYKQGGYFILLGLEEGAHTVAVQSYSYQTELLAITVDHSVIVRPESMVRYIVLNPSEKHPRAAAMPSLRGSAAGFDRIYLQRRGGEMKIAEDDATEGKTAIRLFCSKSGASLPSVYLINDKAASKCEFVMLKGADGDMYMLDAPLKHTHPRSADVIPLSAVSCSDDGTFYFVLLPDLIDSKSEAETKLTILAEKGDKLCRAEVTVKNKGITELGALEFKKG